MRARPEPTKLEHLSDASFLGKLLVFQPNVRLDWQVIASYKHSSLFGLIDSDKGKKSFLTLPPGLHGDVVTNFGLLDQIAALHWLQVCPLQTTQGSKTIRITTLSIIKSSTSYDISAMLSALILSD